MENSSLGKAFSQGVAWFSLLRISSRPIALIQFIVVARFLLPAEFGIMGMALLVLSLLDMLTTTGYDQAMIHKREDIEDYLDTAWLVSVGRGLLLGFIVYLIAPIAASLFNEHNITSVLQVLAVIPVVQGFTSPGLIKLEKELRFEKLAWLESIHSVSVAIVGITFAFFLRSVWALVIAYVLGIVIVTFSSFFMSPYRCKLRFEWVKACELWSFGRWILGSKLMHYLFNNGDSWVVGSLLGPQALGLYQSAYRLGRVPETEFNGVIARVVFPIFVKMRGDVKRLRLAYLRVLQLVMFVSTPVSLGLAVVAHDAVGVLLGERWLPMVPALQVVAVLGWLTSFRSTIGPILRACSRPDLMMKFAIFKVAVLAVLIIPFCIHWGIVGAASAVGIAAILEAPLLFGSVQAALQVRHIDLLRRLLRNIGPAIAMILIVILCQRAMLANKSDLIRLVSSVTLGGVGYLSLTLVLDWTLTWGLWEDIKHAVRYSIQPAFKELSVRFSYKDA